MNTPLVLLAITALAAPIAWTHITSLHDGIPSDAGSGHDADNHCIPRQQPTILMTSGEEIFGFFVPPLDTVDHFGLYHQPGAPFQLFMDPAPDLPDGGPAPNFDLELLDATCKPVAKSENSGNNPDVIFKPDLPPGPYVARIYLPAGSTPATPAGFEARNAEGSGSVLYCHPVCVTIGYRAQFDG